MNIEFDEVLSLDVSDDELELVAGNTQGELINPRWTFQSSCTLAHSWC